MSKLISANWFTIRKNRIILLVCLAMFVVAALSALTTANMGGTWLEDGTHIAPPFENVALHTLPGLGVVYAFVCSLFLNDEFSSGHTRDKIIGGFSRTNVYYSNFITCFCMCALIAASTLLGDFASAGQVNWAETQLSAVSYILTLGLIFLNTAVWAALFTLVGMLVCGRGTMSGVACLIVCGTVYIILLMMFAQIDSMLQEPEMISSYVIYDELTGNAEMGAPIPNPSYLSGADRAYWMTIFEILPVSQATMCIGFKPQDAPYLALYSVCIIAASCFVGNGIFYRRDLN